MRNNGTMPLLPTGKWLSKNDTWIGHNQKKTSCNCLYLVWLAIEDFVVQTLTKSGPNLITCT